MKPCIVLLQTLGADIFDQSLSEESPTLKRTDPGPT